MGEGQGEGVVRSCLLGTKDGAVAKVPPCETFVPEADADAAAAVVWSWPSLAGGVRVMGVEGDKEEACF